MPPSARTLRILWAAVGVGGMIAAVVLTVAGRGQPPTMPAHADAAFYAVAVLSAGATLVALSTMRGMEARLTAVPDEATAMQTVQTRGIVALALAEVPALAAGVAAFLTGNAMVLAFLVPFLAVVGLTWPSDGRVAHWLSLREAR